MIHTAGSPPGTLRRYEGQLGGCITPSPAHATLATVRVVIPTSCDGEARRIRRLRCAETLRCAEMVRLVPETRARVLIDALLHAGNHTALGRAARGRRGDLYYPVLFTNAGENRRQFPNFPLLPTEELDYLRRHMRHPLGETPPTQSFDWLF